MRLDAPVQLCFPKCQFVKVSLTAFQIGLVSRVAFGVIELSGDTNLREKYGGCAGSGVQLVVA